MSKLSSFLRAHGVLAKKQSQGPDDALTALKNTLLERAVQDSADFVQTNIGSSLIFDTRQKIRQFALERAPAAGLVLEFGVFHGESINAFARQMKNSGDGRLIYGFDSFDGLEYDWPGTGYEARVAFSTGGKIPVIAENVRLLPGWIDKTLPPFLEKNTDQIAFIHIDTDTYEACKIVLELCHPRLSSGSIILFDELLCHPAWRYGEFKALNEVLPPDRYVWRAFAGEQAVLQIR